MTQPRALPVQHSVTTMQGLRDELALAQERIVVLRALVAALGWQPITPDSLPRVGDEVLRQRPDSLISPVVDNAVHPNDTTHEDWIALGYTHFRPIHPPTPERKLKALEKKEK